MSAHMSILLTPVEAQRLIKLIEASDNKEMTGIRDQLEAGRDRLKKAKKKGL